MGKIYRYLYILIFLVFYGMDALLGHPLTVRIHHELNQEIDKLEVTQKKELIHLIEKDQREHSTVKK